jgi:hypothetical protein
MVVSMAPAKSVEYATIAIILFGTGHGSIRGFESHTVSHCEGEICT